MASVSGHTASPIHFQIAITGADDGREGLTAPRECDIIESYYMAREDIKALEGLPKLRGSIATYNRLFLPKMLEGRCDKLLCLDADMIVLCDLAEVFAIDMAGQPLGAVFDGKVATSYDRPYFLFMGKKDDDACFNAGMLMFDLKRWEGYDPLRLIHEFARPMMRVFDQSILNAAFGAKHTFPLADKYNILITYPQRAFKWPNVPPGIYHFCGGLKPWHLFSFWNPYNKLWWKEWKKADISRPKIGFGRPRGYKNAIKKWLHGC
jgi:lipopolysaccharide biosynthesis glycosyltransferase